MSPAWQVVSLSLGHLEDCIKGIKYTERKLYMNAKNLWKISTLIFISVNFVTLHLIYVQSETLLLCRLNNATEALMQLRPAHVHTEVLKPIFSQDPLFIRDEVHRISVMIFKNRS